ncbi:hypothetical protein I553_0078 [Mycobacterium xenopi 4042]|uniref:Uncharacterized protein n=1 Tax=Mycobacterium xenopi 4042 TaxID=1299334 RepID=X8BM48_MYCXE|nr:hypothetical protein I553_0078 [Mycobacterium xenopi 4042]
MPRCTCSTRGPWLERFVRLLDSAHRVLHLDDRYYGDVGQGGRRRGAERAANAAERKWNRRREPAGNATGHQDSRVYTNGAPPWPSRPGEGVSGSSCSATCWCSACSS